MIDMIRREYSFVSIGTENSGTNGYMSVSEKYNGIRILSPQEHSIDFIDEYNKGNLFFSDVFSVECLCIIRFQLIAALSLKNIADKNVCVLGCGAIGVAAYLECIRQKAKMVTVITRRHEIVDIFKKAINIEYYNNMKEYDIYIDCSGEDVYIGHVIKDCQIGAKIYLLGTPRTEPSINALIIHRKNLKIFGGHELNGITQIERLCKCQELQEYYLSNLSLINEISRTFVRMHDGGDCEIKRIHSHKYAQPFNILKW